MCSVNDYYSVCGVIAIYDNCIWPRLIKIIMNIIILYLKHITYTDVSPLNGCSASVL